MAGDDRQPWRRHPPFDLVQFGVTDAADAHPDQDFAAGRRRVGPVRRYERRGALAHRPKVIYQHGTHSRISTMSPFFLSPPFLLPFETPHRHSTHFVEPWWRSVRSPFFGSGTWTTREAMHDPGQVVYNDSTTVPLASRSNSSATGSTVKESNDDSAPSGGISRNRSRSGTGGNGANFEKDKATVGPGEQERRESDCGRGSEERVGLGEKRGQGPGQDQEHDQRRQGEEDREGHVWRWLLLVHGGGFRADSGREVGGLGLRRRTRSEPDLRDGLYRPDRPCRGDPDRI